MQNQQQNEFQTLRNAVEEIFECDLLNKSRERNIINARMTFSYILIERGYTRVSIAKYLNKNHATIIHYVKNFSVYLEHDDHLNHFHQLSLEAFNKDFDPVYTMDKSNLKKEVFSLRKQLADLNCKIDLFEKENIRMKSIHDIVNERTHEGSEKEIEGKLNTWFNGVYG